MAFSGMNARERTVVIVLGVVILIALVGIGVLAARLITGGKAPFGEQAAGITVAATEVAGVGTPAATITMVATPSLKDVAQTTPQPVSSQPVVVGRQQSPGPGLPVIIANQPLSAGRRYRLEIAAADSSSTAIQGSWSQGAISVGGEITSPQIEFFEGMTPFTINIASPVANPTLWSMSVSAGPKDILGKSPVLVITVYDVTGSQ